jgi:hypothetical protein
MGEVRGTDFVEAYLARMSSGMTWDEFFDEVGVAEEMRSDFLVAAIVNGARKRLGLSHQVKPSMSRELENLADDILATPIRAQEKSWFRRNSGYVFIVLCVVAMMVAIVIGRCLG